MNHNSIAFGTCLEKQQSPKPEIPSCTQMKKALVFIVLLMTAISLQVLAQASLNFYGNSNYLSKGSVISTATTNFTIEAWVKWDGTGGNQAIVYNGHAGNSGYGIYLMSSGEIRVLIGGVTFVNSGAYLTAGEWTHLAIARNGATLTLYKNGASIANSIAAPYTPNGKFTIGANVDGGETFKGSIDEVQFWAEERSQLQIQSDMNILSLPQTNLLAYYNFNNGTPNGDNTAITTIPDVTGNGNTLMLNNFTLTGNTSNFVQGFIKVAKIYYVNAAATGTGVGTSWTNAYTKLQTAIDAAAPGDEVWVAAGTYQPEVGYAFVMKFGVKIYGGFAGNETSLAQRNFTSNTTILKGSNCNVIINNNNSLDNTALLDGFVITGGYGYNDQIGTNIGQNYGAGIYNDSASPTIQNCIINANHAYFRGGGVANINASPIFINVQITGNFTLSGGGVYNSGGSPQFINVTIAGNRDDAGGGGVYNTNGSSPAFKNCIIYGNYGENSAGYSIQGDILNSGGTPTFTNSLLPSYVAPPYPISTSWSNSFGINGGNNIVGQDPGFVSPVAGISAPSSSGNYRLISSSPAINAGNNAFLPVSDTLDLAGNPRKFGTVDMGAYEYIPSEIYVDSSVGISGDGSSWGNALKNLSDALAFANTVKTVKTIYVAKGTYYPTGAQNGTDRNATFLIPQRGGIEIYGGYPNGGGTRNIQNNPTILSGDIGIPDNKTDNSYHVMVMIGMLPDAEPVVIDGVTITGGNANSGVQYTYNGVLTNQSEGGGILFRINDNMGENIIIRNTNITNNSAITAGGLYLWKSSALIHNTVISENSAVNNGGGIFIHETSSPRIVNSLIVNNTAANGGGIYNSHMSTSLSIINTTISDNTASANGYNIHNDSGAILNMANSIVWGVNSSKNIYNGSTFNATYSDILKETGVYEGIGNINEVPLFVNNHNYTLLSCSPVINIGNNAEINNAPSGSGELDLAGNSRIFGDAVDMGAYELQSDSGYSNFTITTPPSQSACLGSDFEELQLSDENGQLCFIIDENSSQTISAPEGAIFTEVIFASYGNASGSCETGFTLGSCHAANSLNVIENLAVGNNSFTITPNNATFGDPCSGTAKKLYLQIAYEHPGYSYSWTNDNPAIGLPASGTGSIPSFEALEPGVANITLTAVNVCEISDPVTFTYTVEVPAPLYVDANVSVSGNGKSWATAFKTLQEALAAIPGQLCPSDSILVAKGTYMPDNNQSFSMIEGVKIIGGFPNGGGERDIAHNATILKNNASGSIVVRNYYNNLTPASVLDGFTITNVAGIGNMAMYNVNTSPTIRNCIFTGNQANYGGAMHNVNSSPVIMNCIFSENIANINGGAMYNTQSSSPILINCLFSNNRSQNGGGALYNHQSSVLIYNNTFYGNTAMVGSLLFNTASSNTEIINTVMWNNGTNSILNDDECSILYSNIEGGYPGEGNINQEPAFANVTDLDGPDNIWGTEDDGLILQHNSPGVNSGSNDAYGDSGGNIETDLDLAGNPRLYGTTIDMGAYEFQNAQGVIWTINNEWFNGVEPDEEKNVFIQGNLSVGNDYGDFSAQTLTVEEGGGITINTGNTVTVFGKIKNSNTGENQADAFIVKSGGNLIQTEDYQTNDNEGEITVERNSNPIVRLDYAFWSSPVKGQQLQAFSPMTLPNRIYTYETNSGNQGTNGAYEAVSNVNDNFVSGKGYLFRAPNDWIPEDSETGQVYAGKFIGEPSNGNISLSTYPHGFTSAGNPYPSNLDPEKFLASNPGLSNIFFWNNPERVYNEETDSWGYTGSRYITYSALGFSNPDYEGKSISSGQGFIVYTSGGSVNFDNSMRTGTEESFFKTEQAEQHRFWLRLKDKRDHTLNDILIGYREGATNGIDQQIEGEQFGYEGSAIYNLIDEQKYSIQGRPLPFDPSDVVSLGFRSESADKYILSLTAFDGLFSEGQATIYLKDKALDRIHNLMESDYEFETLQGEFKDRFEIVYEKEEGTLAADGWKENGIRIYRHNHNIIIESITDKIASVELFDMQGRNLYGKDNIHAIHYQIESERFGPMVLIVSVSMQSGAVHQKKILNK